MRKRGFTAVELVLVIVVLAIVVTVTLVQVDKRRQARLREESAANLKGLYESFMMNGSGFPALSSEPGQLYPAAEYVERHGGIWAAMTADRYWYLGYALLNEEAGDVFVAAYRKAIEERGKPPTGDIELEPPIVVLTNPESVPESGIPLANESVTISTLSPLGEYWVFSTDIFSSSTDGGPWISDRVFYVAQAGSNQPINSYDEQTRTSTLTLPIPILIERPGLLKGAPHVLWGDGHVEFIPYPGKWPMTERFIKALESLDELKENK